MIRLAKARAATATGETARFGVLVDRRRAHRRRVRTHRTDPLLWGKRVTDERYILVSRH